MLNVVILGWPLSRFPICVFLLFSFLFYLFIYVNILRWGGWQSHLRLYLGKDTCRKLIFKISIFITFTQSIYCVNNNSDR